MKIILFCAGKQARKYCLSMDGSIEILAVADNNQKLHGMSICGHKIISPEYITDYEYDKIVIALCDKTEAGFKALNEIIMQLTDMGIHNSFITLAETYAPTHKRVIFLRNFSVLNKNVKGSVAECGVFRGGFAQYINRFFPDRKLFLFDSFKGFSDNDLKSIKNYTEREWAMDAQERFQRSNIEHVMLRMDNPENVIIKHGYVPETFIGLENECFAFVNLDMDLYEPQLDALRFFLPRMTQGGVILIHDCFNDILIGSRKAIDTVDDEFRFIQLSIGDDSSIALIPY
jgi:hypothetical protein